MPFHTAVTFNEAMQKKGLSGGLAEVKGARHIHDVKLRKGDKGWLEGVEVGYEFLFKKLEI